MTNKELVNQISGLNSTSTLKNWIQLIKEISGKEFKKIKIPISRNPRTHQLSYTIAYDFTDEDLRQFQKLANLKLKIGLKEAIQAVFGSLADNNLLHEYEKSNYLALNNMEYPPDLASGLIERAILFKREDLIPTIKENIKRRN